MAKKTSDEVTEMLELGSGEGPKSGGRKMGSKTQDGDNPIEATDYTYTAEDDEGFNIETTSDQSLSMAQRAVTQAKGDGDNEGVSGGEGAY